jgi:hypothetical protein
MPLICHTCRDDINRQQEEAQERIADEEAAAEAEQLALAAAAEQQHAAGVAAGVAPEDNAIAVANEAPAEGAPPEQVDDLDSNANDDDSMDDPSVNSEPNDGNEPNENPLIDQVLAGLPNNDNEADAIRNAPRALEAAEENMDRMNLGI